MDRESNLYNSYVIKGILANNEFGINEVEKLESIRSFVFDFTGYGEAEKLIKDGSFELIKESAANIYPKEYLDIMQFTDQKKTEYLVTVYDSDELWQNPEVIKIFYFSNEANN